MRDALTFILLYCSTKLRVEESSMQKICETNSSLKQSRTETDNLSEFSNKEQIYSRCHREI